MDPIGVSCIWVALGFFVDFPDRPLPFLLVLVNVFCFSLLLLFLLQVPVPVSAPPPAFSRLLFFSRFGALRDRRGL